MKMKSNPLKLSAVTGVLSLMTFFSCFTIVAAQEAIDLSGIWQFAIDRSVNGIRAKEYRETIELPG